MATTLIVAADLTAALSDIPPAALAGLPVRITAAVERYCGRPLALATLDEEYTPGTTRLLRLKGRPVLSVDRVLTDLSAAFSVRNAPGPWRASAALAFSGDPAWPTNSCAPRLIGPTRPVVSTMILEATSLSRIARCRLRSSESDEVHRRYASAVAASSPRRSRRSPARWSAPSC